MARLRRGTGCWKSGLDGKLPLVCSIRVPTGIVEVIPDGGVYDYKRKYSKGSTEYRFPAVLDLEIEEKLKRLPADLFIKECRDFGSIDFMICEDGNPFFLGS